MHTLRLEEFGDFEFLEDQLGLAPFIDDPDVFGIDLRQAGVPCPVEFVQ